jgi:hypothetical protein
MGIPNTAAAEELFEMFNKQPTGWVDHVLPTFETLSLFVKTILCQLMEAGLATEAPLCTYNPEMPFLTTPRDAVQNSIDRTFSISWTEMASNNVQWGGRPTCKQLHLIIRMKRQGNSKEKGTALITYGNLIQLFDSEGSGRDNLGLGRWTYMRFIGDDKIITRVICGYPPCIIKKKDLGEVYQKHCHHLINKLKDNICP